MTQTATAQRSTLSISRVGRIASANLLGLQVSAARPSTAGTPQVYTIASGSPANTTTYGLQVVVNSLLIDETITYTTDGSATAGEVEAGFAAAWNANPVLFGIGSAEVSGGDLVVTMRDYTTDATLTGSDAASIALLTITETTAPSAASSFPFGRWVQLAAPSGALREELFSSITAPSQADVELTITHGASATYTVTIQAIQGNAATATPIVKTVTWSAGANADATDAAAVAALEAAFALTGFVADAPATGTVTLTAPLGWTLSAWDPSGTGGGGSPDLEADVSLPGALPEIAWVLDPMDESPTSIGGDVTAVGAGRPASILRDAPTVIAGVEASGATPTYGGVVYVECAAGVNNGRPYTVQSATGSRYPLPTTRSRWYGVDPVLTTVHQIQGV